MEYNNPNDYWHGYDPYKGMNDDERMKAGCLHGAYFIVATIVALLLCALLGSCTTTKYVPVIEHRTDTLRITQHHRDSIYLSDSIYVSDFVRDDTVFKTVDRWHTKYVLNEKHDTTYIAKHDSVPVPYPVEVKVEKNLSEWQSFRMTVGTIALFILAIYLIYKIVRKKLFPPAL